MSGCQQGSINSFNGSLPPFREISTAKYGLKFPHNKPLIKFLPDFLYYFFTASILCVGYSVLSYFPHPSIHLFKY